MRAFPIDLHPPERNLNLDGNYSNELTGVVITETALIFPPTKPGNAAQLRASNAD